MPENLGWNLPPLKYLCINSVLVHNLRIQQHKILEIQLGPIQNKRGLYHGSIISLKIVCIFYAAYEKKSNGL